jgi:signal transduction histidine kinase/PAS domain-containing protein
MTDMLRQGENFVVLGPRNVGKRYLLRRLSKSCRTFATAVGVVPFLAAVPEDVALHDGNEDVYLTEDVYLAGANILPPRDAEVLNWLDGHLGQASPGHPVVLLAANVDAIPHQSALRLRKGVVERLQGSGHGGRLAVVFTGEVLLRRHLDDACDWWRVCFTLRGFERAEFEGFARRYLDGLGLQVVPAEGLWDFLFQWADGNVYLLRLLLWASFDRWASNEGLRLIDLPNRVLASQIPWNYYTRYLTRLVTLQPENWARLEDLILGRSVTASDEGPDELELAGLAVRRGEELRLGDTPLHEGLCRHFTARRFADLYAGAGKWPEALERYRLLSQADRVRPVVLDDVVDAGNAVKDLSLSLYKEAAGPDGSAAVRQRFADGCVYLLGFPEVSVWTWQRGDWVCTFRYPPESSPGPPEWYRGLLPAAPEPGPYEPRALGVPEDLDLSVLVALLSPRRSDQSEAVVVGGPGPHPPLSLARRRLAHSLLHNFLIAYGQAVRAEGDIARARRRQRYVALVNDILAALGIEILDVGSVLRVAGEGLREMGYRRVLFCLVDPAGERVEAVSEASDDPEQLLKKLTQYELTTPPGQPSQGVVLAVVSSGVSHRIPKFQADPLARQDVAVQADLGGGAVVPLRSGGRVTGAVLVETGDRGEPTPGEVADLEEFAGKLAAALEQSERVNLLQRALGQQREPVLLLDRQDRVRFANRHAARFLGIEEGWRRASEAAPLPAESPAGVTSDVVPRAREVIEEARRRKSRLVRHLRVQHLRQTYHVAWLVDQITDWRGKLVRHLRVQHLRQTYHVAWLVDQITDWRGKEVGLLANSQELTHVYEIFDILGKLHRANRYHDIGSGLRADVSHTQNLIETMFAIFQQSRPRSWVVLYQRDDRAPDRLVVRAQSGLPAETTPEGAVLQLPPEDAAVGWELGYCLRLRKPVAFVHDPEEADRATITTDLGLDVRNVRCPDPRPAAWEPGTLRIDFPLLAGQEDLGKLTFPCRWDYDPERFQFLVVLAELLAGLLDSSQWFERDWGHRTKWLEENSKFFQREFYHYLGNRLANLSSHLEEIRQISRDPGLPPELSLRCRQLLEGFEGTLRRISNGRETLSKWTLGQFVVKQRIDLCAVVREAIAEVFTDADGVELQGPPALFLDLDPDRFKSLLYELLENSQQWFHATQDQPRLRIRLRVERVEEPTRRVARLVYQDNGPGIRPEDRSQVFKQDFSRRREKGTGFGLYYVSQLIRLHGGSIVTGPPAEPGACFVLELPLPPLVSLST